MAATSSVVAPATLTPLGGERGPLAGSARGATRSARPRASSGAVGVLLASKWNGDLDRCRLPSPFWRMSGARSRGPGCSNLALSAIRQRGGTLQRRGAAPCAPLSHARPGPTRVSHI